MQGGRAGAVSFGPIARPVQRAWGLASRTFQQHPLLVKTVTSGMGFAFGDVLLQLGSTRRARKPLDWQRSSKMGAAGLAAAGPLGYAFILWMEGHIMTSTPHSRLALATKLTLDQVLGFAIWHATLCAIHEPHRQGFMELVGRLQQRRGSGAAAPASKDL